MLEVSVRQHTMCRRDRQRYTRAVRCDGKMMIRNTLICVFIGVIRGAVQGRGELVLTSSPVTATDGELFTLICSGLYNIVNIAWLQSNTTKFVTLWGGTCTKQPFPMENNITRFSVSCNGTVHSIEFIFNSATDQGGWQCGRIVSDNNISPRSNIYRVAAASPVTSTQSSSTTTRYMGTTSEPGTVTPEKDGGDSHTIYIAVAAVGGAVLLGMVVVGIVCIRRKRHAAHNQSETTGERQVEATPVYQNTTSFHTVSDLSAAVTEPETTHTNVPTASGDVNNANMYDSLTSVEMHIYRRLK